MEIEGPNGNLIVENRQEVNISSVLRRKTVRI